jgi:hypothetical protein
MKFPARKLKGLGDHGILFGSQRLSRSDAGINDHGVNGVPGQLFSQRTIHETWTERGAFIFEPILDVHHVH